MNIIQKPSPNFRVGRPGYKPELIVIHIAAGSLTGTDSWFANPISQVSAHYGVGFTGEIHQYVQDENTAWHAGRVDTPTFKLYKEGINPNLYTIGIEHEGQDLSKGQAAQLEASVELIRTLAAKWLIPIDRDHIIGHYQIYSLKPNCPSPDHSIVDKIVNMAQGTIDKEKIKVEIIRLVNLL